MPTGYGGAALPGKCGAVAGWEAAVGVDIIRDIVDDAVCSSATERSTTENAGAGAVGLAAVQADADAAAGRSSLALGS